VLCGRAPVQVTADFMAEVMGAENALTLTKADIKVLDPINAALKNMLVQPAWASVHGGHVAMSCMSLLSLYDPSFLNWRMPQGPGDGRQS
jgi:hypothetical protein